MTIAINIPESLQSQVNQKLMQKGYANVEEYLQAHFRDLVEDDVDDAWSDEISRRIEEIKNGTATTHSLDDVMNEARARINA